jgi:pimeloyl-ACP methyl ester carboxylesterase
VTTRRRLSQRTLSLLELRAVLEAAALPFNIPWLRTAPMGDGHPVVLLPGFGAGDSSLEPLRIFLRSRNYSVETWGFGRNTGFHRKFTHAIEQKIRYLHHRHGRRVSLIGWSLGGVFAFYAAHVMPECVRSVVSLGSPLRLDPTRAPPPGVLAMYSVIADPMGAYTHQARTHGRSMRAPPPVPSTCIYSETDAVVAPQQAVLDGDPHDHENIRIAGSHTGMGFNGLVMWIIADRLAQPEGQWKPFEPKGVVAPVYRAIRALPGLV